MTDIADVQRAFQRICLAPTPAEADLEALHAPRARWLLYRRMVRSRLYRMLRSGLPRTSEVLGKERFDAAFVRYLAEGGPQSRYIRDIVGELVDRALPSWEADASVPAHLCDLARYEVVKWQVASVEWPATDETADELDFEGVPVHNPSVRSTTLSFRVDRRDERTDEALPEPRRLLVYRKPGGSKIYSYLLGPLGGELYDAWQEPDRTFADGVRALLAARSTEPDSEFIDRMAGVLAGLVDHTIILGSRRSAEPRGS